MAQMKPQEVERYVGCDSPLLMVDAAKVDLTRVQRLCGFFAFALGRRRGNNGERKERQNGGGEDGLFGKGVGRGWGSSPIHLHLEFLLQHQYNLLTPGTDAEVESCTSPPLPTACWGFTPAGSG